MIKQIYQIPIEHQAGAREVATQIDVMALQAEMRGVRPDQCPMLSQVRDWVNGWLHMICTDMPKSDYCVMDNRGQSAVCFFLYEDRGSPVCQRIRTFCGPFLEDGSVDPDYFAYLRERKAFVFVPDPVVLHETRGICAGFHDSRKNL